MSVNQNENQKEIEELKRFIATAESNLESAKLALSELTGESIPSAATAIKNGGGISYDPTPDGKVIEGIFDGENMLGPDGAIYPVPANYASKSKLIEGDRLKLTIADDGSFIFKQIGPAARKKVIGTLNSEDNAFQVLAEGKSYNVLFASVTYFKAKPGDRVTIVIPTDGDSHWGAIENVIHDVVPEIKEQTLPDEHNDLPNFPEIETGNEALPEYSMEPAVEQNNLGESLPEDNAYQDPKRP